MKRLRCRIFPDSSSDKCVVKRTNEGRGQQVTEEEKRSRKKKKRKHSAKQEGQGGEEPVTGASRKRNIKDDTKPSVRQRSGSKGEEPLPETPKKKKKKKKRYEWIINLFKGKRKPATLIGDSKEDPAPSQKRKR